MSKVSVPAGVKWPGIGLILLVGLIHFVDAPDSFSEALYKGLLFAANGLGAMIAARWASFWTVGTWAGP